jgi:hypothetical protein
VADRYCPIRKRNMIVWHVAMSTCVLNKVCEFIKTGVPMDKGFMTIHLKTITEVVLKFSGREVGHDRIYNHLRHWRRTR